MKERVGMFLVMVVLCVGAMRLPVQGQSPMVYGPYTLRGLPWAVSGIDMAPDGTVYLVSDVDHALYTATLQFTQTHGLEIPALVQKGDSLAIPVTYAGDEARSGLESVRYVNDSTFLFSVEYDKSDGTPAAAVYLGKRKGTGLALNEIVPDHCFPGTWTNNAGIEGMTLTHDRQGIWIVNERPFEEDRAGSSHRVVRLTRMDFNGRVLEQILYALQPAATFQEPAAYTDNGVSEIFAYDENHILLLERAFGGVETCRTYGRVFMLDLRIAQRRSGCDTAKPGEPEAAAQLVFDAARQCPGAHIDNYEAMTYGPVKNGRQMIMLLSDDNGNWKKQTCPQTTDLILFSIDSPNRQE